LRADIPGALAGQIRAREVPAPRQPAAG